MNLPLELKHVAIDKEAIENISKRDLKTELKKHGIDINAIKEVIKNSGQEEELKNYIKKVEIKLAASENNIIGLIETLIKRIEALEKRVSSYEEVKKHESGVMVEKVIEKNEKKEKEISNKKRETIKVRGYDVCPDDVKLEKFFNFSNKRF